MVFLWPWPQRPLRPRQTLVVMPMPTPPSLPVHLPQRRRKFGEILHEKLLLHSFPQKVADAIQYLLYYPKLFQMIVNLVSENE